MKTKTKTKTTASLAVVGVDIGKEVFHLVGLGTDGVRLTKCALRQTSMPTTHGGSCSKHL